VDSTFFVDFDMQHHIAFDLFILGFLPVLGRDGVDQFQRCCAQPENANNPASINKRLCMVAPID